MVKVALITGGASGMGLAVAKALAARGDWDIHVLDINEERGAEVARDVPRTTFHRANVTKYDELGAAFQQAFQKDGRLDFVFANAGVIERVNFYASPPDGDAVSPPPEPDMLSIDADLKGVVLTSYLAQHYFRNSPHKGNGANIVMTASCGGLYATYSAPMYSAAKFGVVGFMRSISRHFKTCGTRVNAICPSVVRTNLIDQAAWDSFPKDRFVNVDTVVQVVLQLLDGGEPAGQGLSDTLGNHRPLDKLHGLAVEVSDIGFYFRDQHTFADEGMRQVMDATAVENQIGSVLNA